MHDIGGVRHGNTSVHYWDWDWNVWSYQSDRFPENGWKQRIHKQQSVVVFLSSYLRDTSVQTETCFDMKGNMHADGAMYSLFYLSSFRFHSDMFILKSLLLFFSLLCQLFPFSHKKTDRKRA